MFSLSGIQPDGNPRSTHASSWIDDSTRPFAAAGSNAMIHASLLSRARSDTNAFVPSSEKRTIPNATSRSFFAVAASLLVSFFSVLSFFAGGISGGSSPLSNVFAAPSAVDSTTSFDTVSGSPTFSREVISSVYPLSLT